MNFMQAVQVCFSKYVDFSGRARRSEFWWFFLFQVIVAFVASLPGDVDFVDRGPGLAAAGAGGRCAAPA